MSNPGTASILQRVLAVTANSYGLPWQAGGERRPTATGERRSAGRNKASGRDKPTAR
jgi:hypothetical protein